MNSYRRLVPDMSAPINAEWGHDNRSVGLRVPRSEPENRRVENRFIGADTNPYLSIAAALAAGYLGMIEAQEPRPPLEGSSFEKGRDLPYSLLEGIAALEQCEPLRQLLGSQFVDIYAAIKYAEYDAFMDVISPGSGSTCCLMSRSSRRTVSYTVSHAVSHTVSHAQSAPPERRQRRLP